MRPSLKFAVAALALGLALGACGRKKPAAEAARSPLYTGQEAQREVEIYFPASGKPGFVKVKRSIYATASLVNQGKQVLQALLEGPRRDGSEAGAAACFGPDAAVLELYLDGKDLAVVDLPLATVQALPGGTSSEVAVLYCLLRSLGSALPGVSRLQVLIDGEEAETLKGHVDLHDPLTLADF